MSKKTNKTTFYQQSIQEELYKSIKYKQFVQDDETDPIEIKETKSKHNDFKYHIGKR